MHRHPGLLAHLSSVVMFIFWVGNALFLIYYRSSLDLIAISRYFSYGIICSIIGYYFLQFRIELPFFTLSTFDSRNGLVFVLLCLFPYAAHYSLSVYSRRGSLAFLMLIILMMFLSGGRSGSLIIVIEYVLILSIVYKRQRRLFLGSGLFLLSILFFFDSVSIEKSTNVIAKAVEKVNPRLSMLILQEGEGDLSSDRSWLQRRLMIEKAIEIFGSYPITGIGPHGFKYFDSSLRGLESRQRLSNHTEVYYNRRSAHNAYYQMLAEFGAVGILLFSFIVAKPLINLIKRTIHNTLEIDDLPGIALLGMAIHFYTISSLYGTITWVIIALAWTSHYRIKSK